MNKILVTGGLGFLGRNVAKHFRQLDWEVHGLGHGTATNGQLKTMGFKAWIEGDVSTDTLNELPFTPDLIVHAGGGGSVADSFSQPKLDFRKTVESTSCVLEYMRQEAPHAKMIYPSSVAVHGEHSPDPIRVGDRLAPVSPYGIHKLMAENLCDLYRKNFSLDVSVIRFFSVYGDGLKKQLLWDACKKLISSESEAVFWGTGDDVRDWIHVDDAVKLIEAVANSNSSEIPFVNGGSGDGHSVKEVLNHLKSALQSKLEIRFKGEAREGDPLYYVADLTETNHLNYSPQVSLKEGLSRYANWFTQENNQ